MIIELASVGNTPKAVDITFEPGQIDLDGEMVSLAGDASFRGEVLRDGGKVHVRGTTTADVELSCTRCLAPRKMHLDIPVNGVFVDAAEESLADETEVDPGDLDESLVAGGVIEMADVVREQILLAIPIQVLCREDCKGLCPKCGADLNLINCKCIDDEVDPRWAALKNLN